MDFVLQELERNRQMVNQIAYKTFAASGINGSIFPAGPEVCFHLIMDMNFFSLLNWIVLISFLTKFCEPPPHKFAENCTGNHTTSRSI